jgi:membrane protein implicated in regulation of membrane protease activity
MNWALWIWLALAVLFLVVEACTVSLVSIWFSAGALAAVVTNLLGGALWLQLLLFLVVAAALLACLRPLFRKFIKPKMVATNVDSVIGTTGFVTEEISQQSGQVKLGGMYWSARSTTGEKISTGCEVTVDKIEGVKVFVTQV